MKKYLPVISNACFLMSCSFLIKTAVPSFWLPYVLVTIGFEIAFVLLVIFIVPMYNKTFPKILGDIKVKPKAAIRNSCIDIVAMIVPAIIDLFGRGV